jgi:hypothetical protein
MNSKLLLLLACCGGVAAAPRGPSGPVDGSYIVSLAPECGGKSMTQKASLQARAEAIRAAVAPGGKILFVYPAISSFSIGGLTATAALLASECVVAVEPDQYVQLAAHTAPVRRVLQEGQQVVPPGVAWTLNGVAPAQFDCSTSTSRAWIIDSGVSDHPELNIDGASGVNFTNEVGTADGQGHGTMVAGVIGAAYNDIGVVGVCPGARLVSVRVIGSNGTGTKSQLIAGIAHVGTFGIAGDVANLSLSTPASRALDRAVIAAAAVRGVSFVVAAGNEAALAKDRSPARAGGADSADTIHTVSSLSIIDTPLDVPSGFSNFDVIKCGKKGCRACEDKKCVVEFAAPGEDVLTTSRDGDYVSVSGTSFSTPHVTGLILRLGEAAVRANSDMVDFIAVGDHVYGTPARLVAA